MECDLCAQDFDGGERQPKMIVPCGHTACLQCLRRLPDTSCPTCHRDFNGPPEGLPTNISLLQLLQGVKLDSDSRWCSDCRAAATTPCQEQAHGVLPVKSALRRHLQGALPQAAKQLRDLQDQCPDEQALPALTLLTSTSWDVTLRGGDRELTGTLRNTDDPVTKALWLLLAARAALTETLMVPCAKARPQRELVVDENVHDKKLQSMKPAYLRKAQGVTRLVGSSCSGDPAWNRKLLELAAPTVEQLKVRCYNKADLCAVHAMPLLKRLDVSCDRVDALDTQQPLLPALPPGHAGLLWLKVRYLPRATLQSLLQANGHSLQVLELVVGTASASGCDSGNWARYCGDLHWLLQQCGLRTLRMLVLRRKHRHHDEAKCDQQRDQVRRVLPAVEVLCDQCEDVAEEHA